MKKVSLVTFAIIFTLAVASNAAAQTAEPTKVALINSLAFSQDTTGIKKYSAALKAVNTEFTPVKKELETMQVRMQTLETELRAAGTQGNQAKVTEYEDLQRNYKRKAEDAQLRLSKRIGEVTGPLNQAIGTALVEYAKQKGYALILDVSRDKEGLIVAVPGKIDITTEFIAFYNARP